MEEKSPLTFRATIQVTPVFHEAAVSVEAEIACRKNRKGEVEFLSVTAEGEAIPLNNVSRSSLLVAYAKHHGISLS